MVDSRTLLISADDRTGAAEVAGMIADATSVRVAVETEATMPPATSMATSELHSLPDTDRWRVIDVCTRHLSPSEARDVVGRWASTIVAHKMDSTLRGNWSDEVAGLVGAGRRVLVVPALPSMGRTCVGGVVYDHGRPVHEGPAGTDVRRRLTTSNTTELLAVAGLGGVPVLTAPAEIGVWIDDASPCAVVDVADAEELAFIGQAWSDAQSGGDRTVLVGTSEAIVAGLAPRSADDETGHDSSTPTLGGPALVICGSLHPVARAQVEHAERFGVAVASVADDHAVAVLSGGSPLILTTDIPIGPIDTPVAIAAASGLARDAAALIDAARVGAIVIIGGDTASAVIGDRTFVVEGKIEPGMPVGHVTGCEPPVATRAGGFGSADSLDRLVRYQLAT